MSGHPIGDAGVRRPRSDAPPGGEMPPHGVTDGAIVSDAIGVGAIGVGAPPTAAPALDAETAALVATAAVVAAGDEGEIRDALRSAVGVVRAVWVEELILQSYLFAGFPRALNAMRAWRSLSGAPAPADDDPVRAAEPSEAARRWAERGEHTCATVYGPFYERLRVNIAALHPVLDAWMIEEGYGKVLGRPSLDLARRELCVVAACVAARQDRQLHSHLHGALHAGASADEVTAALEVAITASRRWLDAAQAAHYRQLWGKVAGKAAGPTRGDARRGRLETTD